LSEKVKKGDTNLRNKQQAFNEAKQAKLNSEKSKTSSFAARDFNEILAANLKIKPESFVNFIESDSDHTQGGSS